ncbi:hypothetical protein [Aquaspirillum serpens]|uniref:hypothetical protein n=1 Tax=Aquaspirillum serpens TaxID=190 RepID=UPI0012DD321A|nr:hypothetical protein [Aquaspirillum serpens]
MKHLYNVLLVVFCTAMMPVAYAEDAPLPGDFAPQVQKKRPAVTRTVSPSQPVADKKPTQRATSKAVIKKRPAVNKTKKVKAKVTPKNQRMLKARAQPQLKGKLAKSAKPSRQVVKNKAALRAQAAKKKAVVTKAKIRPSTKIASKKVPTTRAKAALASKQVKKPTAVKRSPAQVRRAVVKKKAINNPKKPLIKSRKNNKVAKNPAVVRKKQEKVLAKTNKR